ncbi:hypothetical protein BD309DRAFT_973691 [Dichomitus squalens]|uniref:MYND-type domain-containing protein n=1 Tax=Dichomitus squalens (strain LYAD-421) TaxID=732165 RepID=R7SIL9_DICSQ|nr:uncharacterized protein DICSQDRAFT_158065 [Dichomitus squalens LYAD-421 SS1]EJF55994.1 hypothetical protein DICSQDRAFT_158065 [Dichomitus squalens LYAD-421 SS1]TBU37601.1 hypothetical protein BD309DRAFT_973691 [Dichomitus squalens]
MRESNFAFPAQNRACVCISSQLYDRRALDTNSSLPLFNSLTHLVYLTSTSPRIREIMTMDGGLERLVRILHDFCISPPPPENPAIFYGLASPGSHPSKPAPTLLPKTYDKHAAYRFSLAFQCIVNIGVRGSEPIRSRVVQAGTLEVVGCILEAWLASKGFPVGPSVAANGMPRETREQRMARRQAQMELRQREQAAALARALERQIAADQPTITPADISILSSADTSREEPMQTDQATPSASRAQDTDTSAETSTNATPNGSNTPTGSVVVPGRDRSGTIIARPVWDQPTNTIRRAHRSRLNVPAASAGPSTSTSAANSRPETETEDDGDVDMDASRDGDAPSPSPERQHTETGTIRATHSRRAVGIVSDAGAPTGPGTTGIDLPSDAHIIINDEGVVPGVGVEDGIVSLETNDDFAMGAPPGAPGALDGPPARNVADGHTGAGERTPRAGPTNLPMTTARQVTGGFLTPAAAEDGRGRATDTPVRQNTIRPTNAPNNANGGNGHHHHHHHREVESGPYRDEDVLLSLQLLAYLSKYPHCRQAFYKPRASFHPATANLSNDGRFGSASGPSGPSASSSRAAATTSSSTATPSKDINPFIKAFNSATGRGKEKERAQAAATSSGGSGSGSTAAAGPSGSGSSSAAGTSSNNAPAQRMTNVFALVERFTYRHSSSELESSNPPPSLPPEIQYWAGVIMRNACRKDDSRGGIRQCANMLCGRWERFPREFAKCRRCRKAKYCGKECQSTAWSEGHRFWCSAKDPEEDGDHHHHGHGHGHGGEHSRAGAGGGTGAGGTGNGSGSTATVAAGAPATTAQGRVERREARERERQARAMAAELRLAQEQRGQTAQMVRVAANLIPTTIAATQTETPIQIADPGPSTNVTAGAGVGRSPIPALAAALVDGSWTYRPGNSQPSQWLNDGVGQGADRTQTVASLLRQEPDVTRRQLARELMNSRAVDATLRGHPSDTHAEMPDASVTAAGETLREASEDVDMLID